MKSTHQVEISVFKAFPPKQLKLASLFLLATAAILTLWKQGLEAGSFAFCIYLMAFLSLLILLFPYKSINWKHIFILFSISLTIEIILF